MSRRGLLAGLLLLAGCRIEPTGTPAAPSDTLAVASAERQNSVARVVAAPSAAGLVLPVVGIDPADLADTFGDARSEGRVHDAIDIMAARGTPVVAAAAGAVAAVHESERGGHTVYLLLPDGRTVHYYAHLDAVAPGLVEGLAVRQGGDVGTVGSTGNASPDGPHLHFAIWTIRPGGSVWDGPAVNPFPLLTGRPSALLTVPQAAPLQAGPQRGAPGVLSDAMPSDSSRRPNPPAPPRGR